MRTMTKALAGICGILTVGLLMLLYLYGGLKDNYDLLSEKHARLSVINDITIAAVAVNHRVSLDNIDAKQAEGTEHVKVKTVIKTVFKGSECASVSVPANAVSELQKYAAGIRARAGGSDTGSTDR
ncbi:hypothetical protein [Morganella psychrotolerans]|uniref:DUF2570 domain-containing protein n=1 Tax=Morganella psychrotolerans TaxID=368603 RepID=A0A1B8HTS4_9GAMM|nr:hypothetical protein [Morganella psychrotolerans]OBU13027.1 hypothetical protein AYY18_14300 [Morganella psychrotolerans]